MSFLIREESMMRSSFTKELIESMLPEYASSFAIMYWFSNSVSEPDAVTGNCLNPDFDLLPDPSVILKGIDTASLLI